MNPSALPLSRPSLARGPLLPLPLLTFGAAIALTLAACAPGEAPTGVGTGAEQSSQPAAGAGTASAPSPTTQGATAQGATTQSPASGSTSAASTASTPAPTPAPGSTAAATRPSATQRPSATPEQIMDFLSASGLEPANRVGDSYSVLKGKKDGLGAPEWCASLYEFQDAVGQVINYKKALPAWMSDQQRSTFERAQVDLLVTRAECFVFGDVTEEEFAEADRILTQYKDTVTQHEAGLESRLAALAADLLEQASVG